MVGKCAKMLGLIQVLSVLKRSEPNLFHSLQKIDNTKHIKCQSWSVFQFLEKSMKNEKICY